DIDTMLKLLVELGVEAEWLGEHRLRLCAARLNNHRAPYDLVRKMRASILVLGPLLARLRRASVSLPGGCAIGERPIDQHLKGLRLLGAGVDIIHGYVEAEAKGGLEGTHIYLDVPTVTGTENLMMAAALARGETVIENAAKEPEIAELAAFLNAMGARIGGAGTEVIRIEGVGSLSGTEHRLIPDRIEAGTLLAAAGMTNGNILVKGCVPKHLEAVIEKLREAGMEIREEQGGLRAIGSYEIKSSDVKTGPYPSFPTDMQAQFMALMCLADGTSVITETVLDKRFMHVAELKRMGADIELVGQPTGVRGRKRLDGASVMASDLRASACLVLAGLAAQGTTEVLRIYHLDRGYERLDEKLNALGARIERMPQ
ncbi:MAG TPA: UDP-N-acetylglucosamine 1-carboxyvinyltransferase, partial [Proteobacteria bacterium]|nr:UDP-N-acetylglucosamine 1-carboxyvinyltransferase [Pseudomonadota bacterium]